MIDLNGFRDIPGFENLYLIDKGANVYSKYRNRILTPKIDKDGYHFYHLRKDKKSFYRKAHRLVLEAFVGKSNLIVNHKNGIKSDNRIDNLEYVTAKENVTHAISSGLLNNKGEASTSSKLTVAAVKDILSSKESNTALAAKYGVTHQMVHRVRYNLAWKHVERN